MARRMQYLIATVPQSYLALNNMTGRTMTKAILLAGLGYGDEGKGTITEYLVHKNKAHTVVRYNGGAQAAHNVVTNDGLHHTFSQFGSGTFEGANTYLSRFMLVDPLALLVEGRHLVDLGVSNVFGRIYVDRDAPVITPYHRAANRIRERARGDAQHGSCGVGVGETMSDLLKYGRANVVTVGDLYGDTNRLQSKLAEVRRLKLEQVANMRQSEEDSMLMEISPKHLASRYRSEFSTHVNMVDTEYFDELMRTGTVVFEGAQGVLLDQDYGFQPYTTWTDITFANAMALLKYIGYSGSIERVGVIRSYTTRHGAGPMPTEDGSCSNTEHHNKLDPWQGSFRTGPLDLVATRYALDVIGGVDYIAMTHMDVQMATMCTMYIMKSANSIMPPTNKFMKGGKLLVNRPCDLDYQHQLSVALRHVHPLYQLFDLKNAQDFLGAPIKIESHGKRLADKKQL